MQGFCDVRQKHADYRLLVEHEHPAGRGGIHNVYNRPTGNSLLKTIGEHGIGEWSWFVTAVDARNVTDAAADFGVASEHLLRTQSLDALADSSSRF
jgi:hypothetical protein